MRAFAAAALLALVAPALARADDTSIVARDLPLAGARSLAAAGATTRFDLVGLHWRGSGSVSFRTRSVDGAWTAWRPAAPEDEDGPDRRATERSRPGWRVGNPYWTGRSDRIEYRLRGRVRRLRAYFVRSAGEPMPTRSLAVAAPPAIVRRLSWRANEGIRRGTPSYASSLRFAVVHHTAGSNTYSRAESAAIVRAIQLYHVRGNGWNDIGYNFLVDKYGQVFEGRYGGIERNVIGAHAAGSNSGSVGVALIGNYNSAGVTRAARAALVQLLAWRLDVAHVDPLARATRSFSTRTRAASTFARAIVGHRDTGPTSCPGAFLYARLGAIAREVAATGLPKLYAPAVRGAVGSQVRFTARLSHPLPWTVTVTDTAGRSVATGAGVGPAVAWTWDASRATGAGYVWRIDAGPQVRGASGRIGRATPLPLLAGVRADPAFVSPNGDGLADSTTVSYRLGVSASVTVTLTDQRGAVLATLASEIRPPGVASFPFVPQGIPEGVYRIVVGAVGSDGRRATVSVPLVVSNSLSGFAASPRVFSPNGDGRRDIVSFRFQLARPASVVLSVLRGADAVATLVSGPLLAGAHVASWTGRSESGRVAEGRYSAELRVQSDTATVAPTLPVRADVTAPRLLLLSLRPLRLRVSERASLTLALDGRRRAVRANAAGVLTLSLRRAPRRVRAVATDAAGNVSRAVRYP